MTREEYLKAVEEVKDTYVQLAKDYIEALLKEDFKKAGEISLGTLNVLGYELSAYIAEKIMSLEEFDSMVDGYTEDAEKVEALMMDE